MSRIELLVIYKYNVTKNRLGIAEAVFYILTRITPKCKEHDTRSATTCLPRRR